MKYIKQGNSLFSGKSQPPHPRYIVIFTPETKPRPAVQDITYMNTRSIISLSSFVLLVFVGLIILGLWGCPQYKVYSQRMEGEALLAHAQASKEVAVAEARATNRPK